MAGPVTFNYATFVAMFPEFAGITSDQADGFFTRATGLCSNNTANPAFNAGQLQNCLYLATAHIAWLNAPRDANGMPAATGQPASPIVGRITSANEGSVSVQTDNQYPPGSAQWWQQTRYGSEFWSVTAQFRTAVYVPSGRPRMPLTGAPLRRLY